MRAIVGERNHHGVDHLIGGREHCSLELGSRHYCPFETKAQLLARVPKHRKGAVRPRAPYVVDVERHHRLSIVGAKGRPVTRAVLVEVAHPPIGGG